MCPKGDDPFTTYTDYFSITITTTASFGTLKGLFHFTFQGESFYFNANASAFDDTDCKDSFEGLANVKTVSCTRGTINAYLGTQYVVQFQEFPTHPYQNNIYTHDGSPTLNSFQCYTDRITSSNSPSCTIGLVATASIPGLFIYFNYFILLII